MNTQEVKSSKNHSNAVKHSLFNEQHWKSRHSSPYNMFKNLKCASDKKYLTINLTMKSSHINEKEIISFFKLILV